MPITEQYVVWPARRRSDEPASETETAMVVLALGLWLNNAEVATSTYSQPGQALDRASAEDREARLREALYEVERGHRSARDFLSTLRGVGRSLSWQEIYPTWTRSTDKTS